MKTQIESKRLYNVETSVNGIIENFRIGFTEIINHESTAETYYSMQERLDDIMDLKTNKSMFFQPNRDDLESKGVITRIR